MNPGDFGSLKRKRGRGRGKSRRENQNASTSTPGRSSNQASATTQPDKAVQSSPQPGSNTQPDKAVQSRPQPGSNTQPDKAVQSSPQPGSNTQPKKAVSSSLKQDSYLGFYLHFPQARTSPSASVTPSSRGSAEKQNKDTLTATEKNSSLNTAPSTLDIVLPDTGEKKSPDQKAISTAVNETVQKDYSKTTSNEKYTPVPAITVPPQSGEGGFAESEKALTDLAQKKIENPILSNTDEGSAKKEEISKTIPEICAQLGMPDGVLPSHVSRWPEDIVESYLDAECTQEVVSDEEQLKEEINTGLTSATRVLESNEKMFLDTNVNLQEPLALDYKKTTGLIENIRKVYDAFTSKKDNDFSEVDVILDSRGKTTVDSNGNYIHDMKEHDVVLGKKPRSAQDDHGQSTRETKEYGYIDNKGHAGQDTKKYTVQDTKEQSEFAVWDINKRATEDTKKYSQGSKGYTVQGTKRFTAKGTQELSAWNNIRTTEDTKKHDTQDKEDFKGHSDHNIKNINRSFAGDTEVSCARDLKDNTALDSKGHNVHDIAKHGAQDTKEHSNDANGQTSKAYADQDTEERAVQDPQEKSAQDTITNSVQDIKGHCVQSLKYQQGTNALTIQETKDYAARDLNSCVTQDIKSCTVQDTKRDGFLDTKEVPIKKTEDNTIHDDKGNVVQDNKNGTSQHTIKNEREIEAVENAIKDTSDAKQDTTQKAKQPENTEISSPRYREDLLQQIRDKGKIKHLKDVSDEEAAASQVAGSPGPSVRSLVVKLIHLMSTHGAKTNLDVMMILFELLKIIKND